MATDQKIQLQRKLVAVGIRADEASIAAEMCVRAMSQKRDEMIKAALSSGLSLRDVSRIWRMAKSHVHRLAKECPPGAGKKNDTTGEAHKGPSKRHKLHDHPSRLVSLGDAIIFSSLKKTSFEARVKAGEIPPPVKVGDRRIAWRLQDLINWADSRPIVLSWDKPVPSPESQGDTAKRDS